MNQKGCCRARKITEKDNTVWEGICVKGDEATLELLNLDKTVIERVLVAAVNGTQVNSRSNTMAQKAGCTH